MRIYAHNPKLIAGVRGRSSTVLVLRDRDGSRVELVFTSLGVLASLGRDIEEAVGTLEPGRGDWLCPARWPVPEGESERGTSTQATGHVLWEMGLLHHPGAGEGPGARSRPRIYRRDTPHRPDGAI